MPMSEGPLKSLAVVAEKLREQEAPLRERADPAGLGVGAAAMLVEMAGEEIQTLRRLLLTGLALHGGEAHTYSEKEWREEARAALGIKS